MLSQKATEILFLTNFSDACFRATRAVAQMADDMEVGLTLLYARDPAVETRECAEDKLRSFFPEADRYRVCRRLVTDGDVVTAVAELRARRRIDLAVAPVSDRFTWPRLFHTSVRGRLVKELGLSVWTVGRTARPAKLGAAVKNIACVIDGGDGDDKHLEAAADYAGKLGATLHLLHVMPEVDEGALFGPSALLSEHEVEERYARVLPKMRAEIHVSPGGRAGELQRLIGACDADLLFLNERRSVREGAFSSRLARVIDKVQCPSVCVSKFGLALHSDVGPARRVRVPDPVATAIARGAAMLVSPAWG